jgi:hypothetical protein
MPQVARTLLPIWTYVVTTAPLGPRLNDAITYRGAVTDTDLADNHYRIVGGDRLMWSGGMNTWERNPQRLVHRLKADIQRVYPHLGDVEIAHAWNGVLGNALHRMPQIGELSPHVWLASGFGGHGLNTTAMAGNIVARAIAEGDDTWRLFLPFELVWAGGRIGRAAAQAHYWWFHAREVAKAREARAREDEFRRNQEPAELPEPQSLPAVAAEQAARDELLLVQEVPQPVAEPEPAMIAAQPAAPLPLSETRDAVPANVALGHAEAVARKKRRARKGNDAPDGVPAADTAVDEHTVARKKKVARNIKRKRPVGTE